MGKQLADKELSINNKNNMETPPDFSQFKGKRLDKGPNLLIDGLVHVILTAIGAGLLLAIVYALFTYVNW